MSKLYFRYGVVGSSKSLNLLSVAHNYKQQGKKVILIKPEIDTRFGANIIASRAGLKAEADIIVNNDTDLKTIDTKGVSCILVDEVNFMSNKNIDDLRYISTFYNVPVICYGLRTDYFGNLFEGSSRLMSVADTIEEIKNTCWYCNKKAILNLKMNNGIPVREGSTDPDLGFEDKYLPVCHFHFVNPN